MINVCTLPVPSSLDIAVAVSVRGLPCPAGLGRPTFPTVRTHMVHTHGTHTCTALTSYLQHSFPTRLTRSHPGPHAKRYTATSRVASEHESRGADGARGRQRDSGRIRGRVQLPIRAHNGSVCTVGRGFAILSLQALDGGVGCGRCGSQLLLRRARCQCTCPMLVSQLLGKDGSNTVSASSPALACHGRTQHQQFPAHSRARMLTTCRGASPSAARLRARASLSLTLSLTLTLTLSPFLYCASACARSHGQDQSFEEWMAINTPLGTAVETACGVAAPELSAGPKPGTHTHMHAHAHACGSAEAISAIDGTKTCRSDCSGETKGCAVWTIR